MNKGKLINWKFDAEKLTEVIEGLDKTDREILAAMMGIAPKTLDTWRNQNWTDKFPFPSMSNFLALVNWLDLKPEDFFTPDHENAVDRLFCSHENTVKSMTRISTDLIAGDRTIVVKSCRDCGATISIEIIATTPRREV